MPAGLRSTGLERGELREGVGRDIYNAKLIIVAATVDHSMPRARVRGVLVVTKRVNMAYVGCSLVVGSLYEWYCSIGNGGGFSTGTTSVPT